MMCYDWKLSQLSSTAMDILVNIHFTVPILYQTFTTMQRPTLMTNLNPHYNPNHNPSPNLSQIGRCMDVWQNMER